jgi:hypothetical protein
MTVNYELGKINTKEASLYFTVLPPPISVGAEEKYKIPVLGTVTFIWT